MFAPTLGIGIMFMAFLWCCSIHGCIKEITL